jgi:protein TonB
MHSARPFLFPALVLSLILHAAMMFLKLQSDAPGPQPDRTELKVRLTEPPAITIPAASPRLLLPEEPPRNASAVPPGPLRPRRITVPAVANSPQRLPEEVALQVAAQLARELPYPPEAVERGLQGEALLLLFLDPSGNVIAARLESSSGHAVLDEAALRAARQLRTLPDSAPRETLLPVRFRLR